MVFYTGSASHVVLSDRVSVSLRSSMHIKIDMAFLVVPWLVHPICFFSSFASWLSSLSFHICVLVCDPTRSVARAWRNSSTCHSQFARLGGQIFPSRQHTFFFLGGGGAFLFVIVLFLYELKKITRPASSQGHVEFLLGVKRNHRNPDRSGFAEDPFESSKIRGSADQKKKKIASPFPAGMHDVPRPRQLRAWTLRDRLRPSATSCAHSLALYLYYYPGQKNWDRHASQT